MNRVATTKVVVSLGVMLVMAMGWAGFEFYNVSTTSNSLMDLLGQGMDTSAVRIALVMGIAAVDFAGLAHIVLKIGVDSDDSKDKTAWLLGAAWLIAAAANAAFTWWDTATRIEATRVHMPAAMATSNLAIIPIGMALMVLAIRILLMNVFGGMLERAVSDPNFWGGGGGKKPRSGGGGGGGGNQNMPQRQPIPVNGQVRGGSGYQPMHRPNHQKENDSGGFFELGK